MTDSLAPILRKLDRIAKRDGLTDTAISKAIAGPKNSMVVARLRRGNVTLRTMRKVEAWITSRQQDGAQ